MAKPKLAKGESGNDVFKGCDVTPSKFAQAGPSSHVGQGDSFLLGLSNKKKPDTPTRYCQIFLVFLFNFATESLFFPHLSVTFPLTPMPRKQKSKFTMSSSGFGTLQSRRIPSKSQSIPNISDLTKLSKVSLSQSKTGLSFPPTMPVVHPARKSANTIRMKVVKPRKSVTMLELRPSKLNKASSDMNYVKILETLGQQEPSSDGFDEKYKYLAYKTYCFMMKNAWKRAKDERQEALERVAKLQTNVSLVLCLFKTIQISR